MIAYYINALEPSFLYGTMQEAVDAAREALASPAYDYLELIEIERCEIVPLTKANVLDIINSQGGSWCRASEVVKTVRRRARA